MPLPHLLSPMQSLSVKQQHKIQLEKQSLKCATHDFPMIIAVPNRFYVIVYSFFCNNSSLCIIIPIPFNTDQLQYCYSNHSNYSTHHGTEHVEHKMLCPKTKKYLHIFQVLTCESHIGRCRLRDSCRKKNV